MPPDIRKLFEVEPATGDRELVRRLIEVRGFRLEQIVSHGACSPPDFWYQEERDEWVLLARGTATLEFEDGMLELVAGDSLVIPAMRRHRVVRTSADAIWIALHYGSH